MSAPRHWILAALALILAVCPGAWPGDLTPDCVPCATKSAFPEMQAILDTLGYPASQYIALLAWDETARDAVGTPVDGCRLSPRDGGEPFDVYIGAGKLLDAAALKRLGVTPKQWGTRPAAAWRDASAQDPQPKAATAPRREISVPSARVQATHVDVSQAIAEDLDAQAIGQKGGLRMGVFAELPGGITVTGTKVSDGRWLQESDGAWTWSVIIASPDAVGMRLRISEAAIPAGVTVTMRNAENPAEMYEAIPYGMPEARDLWTPSCFADEVILTCAAPSREAITTIRLTVDRIVHIYREFNSLPWAKAAAECNLDVSCYPEWALEAKAVGGIGTIGQNGLVWCTGALLATVDPDTQKPYLLTANHCVADQYQASTTEFYWLYQTSVCGGAAPSPVDVPRTSGGAYYLAGAAAYPGNDFTLLRLKETPYPGAAYAGWTSTTPDKAQSVTGIHHPNSDYKRISIGKVTNSDANFLGVEWTGGITEPGSSGSPLFDSLSHDLVGQLYGGESSCGNQSGEDTYGRFSQSLPLIEAYLDPANVDPLSAPPAPTDVNASDGGLPGAIRVTWEWAAGAYEYQLSRSTVNDPLTAQVISPWQCQNYFVDENVEASWGDIAGCATIQNKVLYYYWAKARNDWGVSRASRSDSGFADPLEQLSVDAAQAGGVEGAACLVLLGLLTIPWRVRRHTRRV